jgi:hypothetical protein
LCEGFEDLWIWVTTRRLWNQSPTYAEEGLYRKNLENWARSRFSGIHWGRVEHIPSK